MATGTLYGNAVLFTESVSAVTATNTVQLGTVRWEGGKQYRYVYMEQSAQVGYAVQLTSGGSGYSVTASMVTGDTAHGVVQNTTMTTATYGWILQRGPATIQVGSGGVSTSKKITVLSSGSFGDWVTYQNAANSGSTGNTLGTNWMMIQGRTLGSAATAGSILAYVKFSFA